MKKKVVNSKLEFYYDIKEKGIIIARKMTNANKLAIGSDNSLYFGLLDIEHRFENGDKIFNCPELKNKFVKITINANQPNGQFQLKVSLLDKETNKTKTNGAMNEIIKAKMKKGGFTIDDDLIFIADFINWKVDVMKKSTFEELYNLK